MIDAIDVADYPVFGDALVDLCDPECWREFRAVWRRWHTVAQNINADQRLEFLTHFFSGGSPKAFRPDKEWEVMRGAYWHLVKAVPEREEARRKIELLPLACLRSATERIVAGELQVIVRSCRLDGQWMAVDPDRFARSSARRPDFWIDLKGRGWDVERQEYAVRVRDLVGVPPSQGARAFGKPDLVRALAELEQLGAPDRIGRVFVDREVDFEGGKSWKFRDASGRWAVLHERLATDLIGKLKAGALVGRSNDGAVAASFWDQAKWPITGDFLIGAPSVEDRPKSPQARGPKRLNDDAICREVIAAVDNGGQQTAEIKKRLGRIGGGGADHSKIRRIAKRISELRSEAKR